MNSTRSEAIHLLGSALVKAGGLPSLEAGEFWLFDMKRARCGGWDYVMRRCPSELLTAPMRQGEAALRAQQQPGGLVVFLLIEDADGRILTDVVWVEPGNGPSPGAAPAPPVTTEPAALLEARDARAHELAQRLVGRDGDCRRTLLAAQRALQPTEVLTLFVTVDSLDSLRATRWIPYAGPRADVAIDPDGERVLRDLSLLEKAGHAALIFYITDEGHSARLVYCVSLFPAGGSA